MDTPLFERPESSLEQVALTDIEPWSTSGAKSYTAKSIGTLSLRSVVMLQRLPQGSSYRFRVIDGNRRLDAGFNRRSEARPGRSATRRNRTGRSGRPPVGDELG